MASCFNDALRELASALKGGSMDMASERTVLVERLRGIVDSAAASHSGAGYDHDKARAGVANLDVNDSLYLVPPVGEVGKK